MKWLKWLALTRRVIVGGLGTILAQLGACAYSVAGPYEGAAEPSTRGPSRWGAAASRLPGPGLRARRAGHGDRRDRHPRIHGAPAVRQLLPGGPTEIGCPAVRDADQPGPRAG